MPIARENRFLYPIDWLQLSIAIRFGRAKGRCEWCARPHGKTVEHLGDGRWWDEESGIWRDDSGRRIRRLPRPEELEPVHPSFPGFEPLRPTSITRVYLATAHLNHDPSDSTPRNLAALCQRCHMRHDAQEHRYRRWLNYFIGRALADLFPYFPGQGASRGRGVAFHKPAQLLAGSSPVASDIGELDLWSAYMPEKNQNSG